MAEEPETSERPVESRWWYWIAAYPVFGLLAIPIVIFLAFLALMPFVVIDQPGGEAPAVVFGIFAIAVGVVAFAFVLVGFAIFLMLPIALYFDAKAVRDGPADWDPDPFVYALLGALQFFVTPLIGFIVAIYYLYRRHVTTGVP